MLEPIRLPDKLVSGTRHAYRMGGPVVEKTTIEGIDEIQYLSVSPWTSINKHGHNNQREVWVDIESKTAYVCLKGEEHELVNSSSTARVFMAIKGHKDYTYDDLSNLFYGFGFSVTHGSLIISD